MTHFLYYSVTPFLFLNSNYIVLPYLCDVCDVDNNIIINTFDDKWCSYSIQKTEIR